MLETKNNGAPLTPPRYIGALFVALVTTVTGLRWATFNYAGSPLPFFDQWLAEFNNLYLNGVVNGTGVWFTAHNEHHQITMKLASMLGFLLNGYWGVKFLGVAAGVVRAACAGVAWLLLSHQATDRQRILMWLVCAIGFGVPWSAFNALNGMQISFFFADLAMLFSLLVVQRWQGWRSGITLIILILIGLGSMASALAIPLATLTLHLAERKPRPGFVVCWVGTLIFAVIYVLSKGGTGSIQSIPDSIHFFLTLLAWPLPWAIWGAAILAGGIALLILHIRRQAGPRLAIAYAFGVFAVGNIAMLALGRTPTEFHPRHWESVGWLPFAIIILLLSFALNCRLKPVIRLVSIILASVVVTTVGLKFAHTTWPDLRASHENRETIVQHYREALLSGDFRAESARVNEQLIARDYTFFDDPIGRFAIHPIAAQNITAAPLPALALLGPDILPSREPSISAKIISGLIRAGGGIAIIGMLTFSFIGIAVFRQASKPNKE